MPARLRHHGITTYYCRLDRYGRNSVSPRPRSARPLALDVCRDGVWANSDALAKEIYTATKRTALFPPAALELADPSLPDAPAWMLTLNTNLSANPCSTHVEPRLGRCCRIKEERRRFGIGSAVRRPRVLGGTTQRATPGDRLRVCVVVASETAGVSRVSLRVRRSRGFRIRMNIRASRSLGSLPCHSCHLNARAPGGSDTAAALCQLHILRHPCV